MPSSDDRRGRSRRHPRRRRASSASAHPAQPSPAPPPAEPRGHWRVTAAAEPLAIFARLAALLPTASHIVTAGDRRSWTGAADVLDESAGAARLPLARGEQLLRFSGRAIELLGLAARTDAPTPFCRELRIYRDDALLLRWATPPLGELRISAAVATSGVWLLAATARGTHGWRPEQP
jgi:hypothetical protein